MPYRFALALSTSFAVFGFVASPPPILAQSASGTDSCCARDVEPYRSYKQGHSFVVESENFQICCEQSESAAIGLAKQAESLRTELRRKWLGDEPSEAWSPRCKVLVYATKQRYVAAVGRGSERTVGSSLVNFEKGQITERRIDLDGGSITYLADALPHELTHVVLKDRFNSNTIPRWADEGAAILADSKAKQGRHFNDLKESLKSNTTFNVASLFTLDGYPAPGRFGTFYGQSASLAEFLVSRKDPRTFIEFIALGKDKGFDLAIKECYGIANMAELDRAWRKDLYNVVVASN